MTPLKISLANKGFQYAPGKALCTYHLKTEPFRNWLKKHYDSWEYLLDEKMHDGIEILYGFDANEKNRISRRRHYLKGEGYKTDFPLAYWARTIAATEEIGIARPSTYSIYKHANCIGCLKAGRQHWYVVYCTAPHIFAEALEAEAVIGHSIIKGVFLDELLPKFEEMKTRGIVPEDKTNASTFWARVNRELKEEKTLPCECAI